MSNRTKTTYQIYYEEQFKLFKAKGVTGNEATKQIGNLWSKLTPQERKPYEDKKKDLEQQMSREQEVMKTFSKNNQKEKQTKATVTATATASSKSVQQQEQEDKSSSQQSNLKRFTKEHLKKDIVDSSKKVLIQKVDNTGKVLLSNQSQQSQQQQQPSQKQTQNVSTRKTEQTVQSKKPTVQQSSKTQGVEHTSQRQTITTQAPAVINSEQVDYRKANHEVYLQFYKDRVAFYRKRFPNRKIEELTSAIKEEWKIHKLANKLQEKEKKVESKTKQTSEHDKFLLVEGKKVEVPKKPLSGFVRYYKEVQHQIKESNPLLSQTEIAKQVSAQWKNMAKEEQDPFNNEFHKEQVDYNKKMAEFEKKYNFKPKASQKEPKKTSKNFVILNGAKVFYPIKLGGYFIYQKDARQQLKNRKHTYNSQQISSFLGQTWKELKDFQKEQYEKQSEILFEEQKREFIKKYGDIPELQKQKQKSKSPSATKTELKKKPEPKKLNGKRPAPSSKINTLSVSIEEKEEQLKKKHERKMQINYDDVESEIEDIYSQIDENEKMDVEDSDDGKNEVYGDYYGRNNMSLKTKREEEFEKIEKQFTKNKKVKGDQATASVQKSKNNLFDMLNQPIPIPDFDLYPDFF